MAAGKGGKVGGKQGVVKRGRENRGWESGGDGTCT